MTGPGDRSFANTGEQSLGRRYRLLLILAWATVVWERLWRSGWKPVLVFATFAAVVLLDLLPSLPAWAHGMVLLAFKITFGVFLYQAAKNFRGVSWALARRRLERDSGLAHRPLASLADQPAERGDGLSLQLWLAHMRRLVEQVQGLKLALPSPGLAARDPYGVRAVVLLLLVVGLVAGSGEAGSRLARAYTLGGETDDQFRVEIWLTPPLYSRRSPIFLSNRAESDSVDQLDVPLGTTLNARIAGRSAWYVSDPAMEIGDRDIPISPIGGQGGDKKSFSGETILQSQDLGTRRLAVRANGGPVAEWRLAVLPDLAPVVGFSRPPQADKRMRLALAYEASDDYAVENLSLEIRLQDGSLLAADRVTRLEIPVAGAPLARQRLKGETTRNLVAHPWAGLAVELTLRALDGAGQEGLSAPATMILPERQFTHPVAKAIIAQRRRLALLKPGSARKIARDVIVGLELIKQKPTTFESSTTVFLALGVAQARLRHSQDIGKYEAVMDLLWNVAISLEDGELAVAERELETAREELNEALANDADGDEIERLMDRVAEALDNYLKALAEQLQAEGGVEMDLNPLMRMLGADDLRQLLEQARQMARTGATEAARQMLSQLDRLLEGVQGAMQGGSAMADMNQVLQQFSDMLERVRRLAQRQQDLLDDTFKDDQNGAGKSPVGAAAQKALREQLGDLMLDADELLGTIPPALGRADRDMNDAAQSLARGKLADAVGQQSSAVENLRQGIEQMSSQMAQMMAGTLGLTFGQNGMGMGQMSGGRDPFGRLTGNGGLLPGGKIGIPERGQVHRSRQILDELRRRAGQQKRPKPERDYIDRLLKKF